MRDQKKERRGLRAFGRKQDGVMAVIFVICMPLIIGVCALVIDLGYAWMTRNQLQATADASSLAAASKLNEISPSDTSVAVAEANALAEANMAAAGNGDVLVDSDIVFGFFSPITWQFSAGMTPYNAVRTTTRRAAANDNPLGAIFAVIFGRNAFDVNTSSVAVDGKFDDFLACMHALNETADDSLYVFGNATLNAQGCDIQVDSCSNEAFTAQGNPLIVNTNDADEPGSFKVCGDYTQVGGSVDIDPCTDADGDGQCDIINDDTDFRLGDPFSNIVEWDTLPDTLTPNGPGDEIVELPSPSTDMN
ncbi:MAG: pilus assembly protein TadG-related protein, partial [Rhodovibrionaceae bacterium]|nr:pilus assembly protein TadG-related protein [Rhodovibrionaceae bacterium]